MILNHYTGSPLSTWTGVSLWGMNMSIRWTSRPRRIRTGSWTHLRVRTTSSMSIP